MLKNKEFEKKTLLRNGRFNIGKYKFPLKKIKFTESYRPYGFFSPNFLKKLKLKEWQAFQAGNSRFFLLIAIYNPKSIGIARFILFDKEKSRKYFYEKKVFPFSLNLPESLLSGKANYISKRFKIDTFYESHKNELKINIEIKKFKKLPNVKFTFTAFYNPDKQESISACIPFAKNRAMYSHKGLCNASGELILSNKKHAFNKNDSFLIFDDHKGFYPNPMIYDWITGAKTIDEKSFGFNFTDNQSTNPDLYNENCFWEGGKTYFLGSVKFSRPEGVKGKWYIKDENGDVDLSFTPIDHNPFYLNIILLKARYEGPFGYISGKIKTREKTFEIEKYFGMGEKKYIKG